ncbi:MAG: peptidase M75 [Bacteroidaceae bacterium]|nr:peptidase M75 [Bacteroidaceae bacterium]
MKKNILLAAIAMGSMAMGLTSCSKDDDNSANKEYYEVIEIESLDYTSTYQKSWNNYMKQVTTLLYNDSEELYDSWTRPYNATGYTFAEIFKTHDGNGYESVEECLDEIIDKMAEIANEVGGSKIGGPYDLWTAGNKRQAVLEVESWYSWHSIDDYTNNIRSVRNVYYGKYFGQNESARIQNGSMASLMQKYYSLDHQKVDAAITAAMNAIQSIPAPFRNYIAAPQVITAIDACADLQNVIKNTLKRDMKTIAENYETDADKAVAGIVDNVIVPTYQDLYNKNTELQKAVNAFIASPTNAGFTTLANAWMASRRPWETSEAFLFGPVDALSLDPNMDSWPLDQDGIERNIKAGNFDNINWSDGDDDDAIEAAQNLRGFHTLEYLIFKDGKARTIVSE